MMVAPDELMALGADLNKIKPCQRRLLNFKALCAICCQQGFEALLLSVRREFTPIVIFKRQGHFLMNDLKRVIEILPMERSAKDRVPLKGQAPGTFKSRSVQLAGD